MMILYFLIGCIFGGTITFLFQRRRLLRTSNKTPSMRDVGVPSSKHAHLEKKFIQQRNDYESHIEQLNKEHQLELQQITEHLSEVEDLILKHERHTFSSDKINDLTNVSNQLKLEIDALLELVQTFKRWHDGLSEIRTNNKLMNKLNSEFKAVGTQTVTLSLNASIEASKSGEMGKGFKVVAQEISQLAQQTQELCNNYAKGLHKNDLLTTTAFQDTQAGSRMVLNAVDGLIYLISDLQREIGQFHQHTQGNQLTKIIVQVRDLQNKIISPQDKLK